MTSDAPRHLAAVPDYRVAGHRTADDRTADDRSADHRTADRGLSGPRRVATGEPLWRDVLGDHLRRLRQVRGETLSETARRAGVSPQYLSEMERGIKEPSSEMIAAVAGALDTSLVDVTTAIARNLRGSRSGTASGPTCRVSLALAA